MNIENQKFDEWRNEQISSLIRMGYPDAAKAFRELGSIHWAGWQAAWIASRAAIEVELPAEDPLGKGPGDCEGGLPSFEQHCAAECNALLADCRQAIESLGLKVKP